MKQKTLAIIGTAGRREDGEKLTKEHWQAMTRLAVEKVVWEENPTSLVSGGAAWADHVAVHLRSILFPQIPCHIWLPKNERDLEIARYYHRNFSAVVGYDTRAQINTLAKKGMTMTKFGGFKDRNTKVAEAADVFLAITFGHGDQVKDGGTADTVRKLQYRGVGGYHLDLNTLTVHRMEDQDTDF